MCWRFICWRLVELVRRGVSSPFAKPRRLRTRAPDGAAAAALGSRGAQPLVDAQRASEELLRDRNKRGPFPCDGVEGLFGIITARARAVLLGSGASELSRGTWGMAARRPPSKHRMPSHASADGVKKQGAPSSRMRVNVMLVSMMIVTPVPFTSSGGVCPRDATGGVVG